MSLVCAFVDVPNDLARRMIDSCQGVGVPVTITDENDKTCGVSCQAYGLAPLRKELGHAVYKELPSFKSKFKAKSKSQVKRFAAQTKTTKTTTKTTAKKSDT